MRVTTSLTQRAQVDIIQSNLQRFVSAQNQVSTGRRFERASEDPAGAGDVMRADGVLASYAQFERTMDLAIGRASEEDRVLSQLGNVIDRARELAVGQAGSPANADTRAIVKTEIDQLLQTALGLGNTRFGEGYLFGGARALEQPLTDTPAGTPPYIANNTTLNAPVVEIAAGVTLAPNHTAHAVFRDTNVLVALRDLSTALGANDVAGITAAITTLETSGDGVSTLLGTTGARVNQLEMLKANMASATVDTQVQRSNVQDIDIAEAMATFSQAQTAYQAALTAAGRVVNLNVMDYLR
jgi:flagellar hook-associated protein 3 FlgL